MKLFLSSMAISAQQADAFAELVGKEPSDIKLALFENAADVYDDDSTDWVDENRATIKARGYQVDILDLRDYSGNADGLRTKLTEYDAIWLGGGNTFYLRWLLKDTGADVVITELVKSGTIYGGGSAGAIVAGPTLKYFEDADDPEDAPEIVYEGLSLSNIQVVPHIGNQKYGHIMELIAPQLRDDDYEVVEITDEQAYVVDGEKTKVVG